MFYKQYIDCFTKIVSYHEDRLKLWTNSQCWFIKITFFPSTMMPPFLKVAIAPKPVAGNSQASFTIGALTVGDSGCQVELVVILEPVLKNTTTSDFAKYTVFAWSRSPISILTLCQSSVNYVCDIIIL